MPTHHWYLSAVGVDPARQGEGLGALLIEESLSQASGWDRVMLVGDAPYYGRFGFAPLPGLEMPPPTNPDRVLGRALVPGAWEGVRGSVSRWPADWPRPLAAASALQRCQRMISGGRKFLQLPPLEKGRLRGIHAEFYDCLLRG